ncbi:hypothetical protein JW979_14690 [bacterium]|nr:hypothetical protein [candidate division CSSED10-310 bacterium]
MVDKIRSLLESNPEIHAWKLVHKYTRSDQLYLSFNDREAERCSHTASTQVTLFTRHRNTKGQYLQGSTFFEVPENDSRLEQRIDNAIARSRLQNNEPYDLTPSGLTYPEFNDADSEICQNPEKVLKQLETRLHDRAASYAKLSIPSSEFFLTYEKQRFLNSNGIDVDAERTKILWDIVLLYRLNGEESEFWNIFSRQGLSYFHLESDFEDFVTYAEDATHTAIPKSGKCPVIITGDALHILFQYFIFHSAASSRYNNAALFKPGAPVLKNAPAGDPLTMFSNPQHPGGSASYRFDGDALPGKRIPIIENGVLRQYWATKQYADYLGIEPTGDFGNIEISSGSTPWNDLIKATDRVILVVQFSTFDPQPIAGDFMGEIRVGYEYRANGEVIPLRGGSISGNVAVSMENCRFSKEMATFDHYYGPRGVRFESIQVAGE